MRSKDGVFFFVSHFWLMQVTAVTQHVAHMHVKIAPKPIPLRPRCTRPPVGTPMTCKPCRYRVDVFDGILRAKSRRAQEPRRAAASMCCSVRRHRRLLRRPV